MKRLLPGLVLAALAAAACTPPNEPGARHPCDGELLGSWIPDGGVLLGCTGNALALAARAPSSPVLADGRTIVDVTARVGLDFQLSAAQVELNAVGGAFPSAASVLPDGGSSQTNRIVVSTDERGVLSTALQVDANARQLVLHGRIVSHANSGDAGVGVADTFLHVDTVPPTVARTLVSADGGALSPGGAMELEIRGYFDEWMQVPAEKAPIQMCLDAEGVLTSSWSHQPLGAEGRTGVVVRASSSLLTSGQVTIRACPSALACESSPACGELRVPLKPAVLPIERVALTIDSATMKVGDERTITAFAYSDTTFSTPAAKGAALRLCATKPGILSATLVQLEDGGKANVRLRALEPTATLPISVVACPYEHVCNAQTDLPPSCSPPLEQYVAAASQAIASMVVSFNAPPLVEGKPSTVTVAAFSDQARTQRSPANHPVRFCVDAAVAGLGSTAGFLDDGGTSSVLVTPRAGSAQTPGALSFMACPYDVACDAGTTACQTEIAAIIAPEVPDAGTGDSVDGGSGDGGVPDGGN